VNASAVIALHMGIHQNPLNSRTGDAPQEVMERGEHDAVCIVRLWDATYRKRIARWPVFLVSEVELLDLNNPRFLSETQMARFFGRIPATLNPPSDHPQTEDLIRLAKRS
jgi:hypothetical protein